MLPFKCDEKVTIERKAAARDPNYGTEIELWELVVVRAWANVQDELPSRAESTQNGLRLAVQRSRLRIRINKTITTTMRVTLHGKDGRIMQIIAGPALLDDRAHMEFMLESYSS